MSIFDNGFDPNSVEAPSTDLLPVDWYVAVATKVEPKDNQAKGAKWLDCEFEIVDGPHARRKVWTNITTSNQSETATQIGLSQLSAWCKALNVAILKDSSDLMNKPMLIHVKIEKGTNGYSDKNKVVNHKPHGGAAAPQGQPQQAPATEGSKPPWA